MGIKEKIIRFIEDAMTIEPVECENGDLVYTIDGADGMSSYIIIPKEEVDNDARKSTPIEKIIT